MKKFINLVAVALSLAFPSLASAQLPMMRVPLDASTTGPAAAPAWMWNMVSSNCSSTCGNGTTSTTYACQNANDFDWVGGTGLGSAEPAANCVAALGAAPADSVSACTSYTGCLYDWVRPPEVATPLTGRVGCGNVRREYSPSCQRSDGSILAAADHAFCSNDLPDYNDVSGGVPDALGYNRIGVELGACNPSDHSWSIGAYGAWSSTCSSSAFQTRTVECRRTFDGQLVGDGACAGPKPDTTSPLGNYSSCTYSMTAQTPTGAYTSTCSASAQQSWTGQCRRSDGTIVADSECTSRGVPLTGLYAAAPYYAGCSYSSVNAFWVNGYGSPSGIYTSTCSANALQLWSSQCQRSDGTIVADSECTSRGVTTSAYGAPYEPGGKPTYHGCNYVMVNQTPTGAYTSTCSASAQQSWTGQCQRSDGTIVADSECTSRGVPVTGLYGATPNYSGCGYSSVNAYWVNGYNSPTGFYTSTCSSSSMQLWSSQCERSDGTIVPDSECTSRSIAMSGYGLPYEGTKGVYHGCGYAMVNQTPTGAYTSYCSGSAQQSWTGQCQRSDGQIVPDSECTGRSIPVTGLYSPGANYSSCGYARVNAYWVNGYNSPTGFYTSTCSANAEQLWSSQCQRSDGTIVADSECTSRSITISAYGMPYEGTKGVYHGCSYTPEATSGFSACASGTQTRSMACRRSDGALENGSYCGYPSGVETQACVMPPAADPTIDGYYYNADGFQVINPTTFNRPWTAPSSHREDGQLNLGTGNGNHDFDGFTCGFVVNITYQGDTQTIQSFGYDNPPGDCLTGTGSATIGGRFFQVSGTFYGSSFSVSNFWFDVF